MDGGGLENDLRRARSKLIAVVNEEAQMPGLAAPADWLISYVGVSR